MKLTLMKGFKGLTPFSFVQVLYLTQSNVIISRPNVIRDCFNHCRNSGRISIRWWIHKTPTIPRPNGREYFWENWPRAALYIVTGAVLVIPEVIWKIGCHITSNIPCKTKICYNCWNISYQLAFTHFVVWWGGVGVGSCVSAAVNLRSRWYHIYYLHAYVGTYITWSDKTFCDYPVVTE